LKKGGGDLLVLRRRESHYRRQFTNPKKNSNRKEERGALLTLFRTREVSRLNEKREVWGKTKGGKSSTTR